MDVAIKDGNLAKVEEIIFHENKSLIYSPTRKHQKGGWGTEMDLSDETALKLLNESEPLGKQRYGYEDGSIYEYQPDNIGGGMVTQLNLVNLFFKNALILLYNGE